MSKILLIDDDEQIRSILKRMLTRDGHEVSIAQDGLEGLNIFYQLKPDLVITDINMPNKNGFELISDIFKVVPEQPIIVMSGGRRTISENLDFKVRFFLEKPFTIKELQAVIKLALVV